MHAIIWDLETRSAVNLREAGAYIYAIDPTTQPLCLAYVVDNGEPQLWLPTEPPPPLFLEIAANPGDWILVAHNFEFERLILEHCLIPRHGFQPIPLEIQHCSQRLALANAFPPELDLLAQALALPYRKDPAARRAMLQVSRPRANRKRKATTLPAWDEDPAKLQLVYERCLLDVVTTRAVFNSFKLERLSETERRYQLQDAAINARGVRLDRQFVTAAMDLAFRERSAVNLKLEELTRGAITSVDQNARFLSAINDRGHAMTTVNKRAVAQVLANQPDDYVRQLLELRQIGARAAVNKFKRMLAFASPHDDRLRGCLRMYGTATGRWTGLGPQLQNLKKNESGLPLAIVDSVRRGARVDIAQYGEPLALLGDISRASLCAAPGMELMSGDFSAIESVVLAWLSNEQWKLDAYRTFQQTGDTSLEPYRIIARRMLNRPTGAEITGAERQLGKAAELASGFGGSAGAWRRIAQHDSRTDDEIKAIIHQWRAAHPATRKFWNDLARSLRIAIRTGAPILIAPAPQPPIVATFEDGILRLRLPSGRAIAYPNARLIPAKFEEAAPDIEFYDNARAQWKPYRGWFGVFVENVVSGIARDLLATAIARFEERGLSVVFHCHDELTIEAPIGALSDQEFRDILLDAPAWATGLPLSGKVHAGQHYLPAPEREAEIILALPNPEEGALEAAIDAFIDETRDDIGPIDDPGLVEREDDDDFIATLPDDYAPLIELVSLPLTTDNKCSCPFHGDVEPSCTVYADHFHCYGCGEHGDRLDWLTRAEGLTRAEAIVAIKDWTGPCRRATRETDAAEKHAYAMAIWAAAGPIGGSIAERYLDETRGVDVARLPQDIHGALRFHPLCVFGPGVFASCLIALMTDPLTDAPVGVQRIAIKARNGRIEKIGRMMLGSTGVVKIWPAGRQLAIAEGLETTLAAATRIPFEGSSLVPAWAAVTKGGLAELPLIDGVERLIVLADNDANGEGQRAAESCKRRWQAAGRVVVTLMPDMPDSDFNDLVLQEDARAASHA